MVEGNINNIISKTTATKATLLYRLLYHELREEPNEYCLPFQVPGCNKEDLAVKVNKLHLKISVKYNPAWLVSYNDKDDNYLQRVPDVSLLHDTPFEITKKVLLPWNSDVTSIRAEFSKNDQELTIFVPKLEELEVPPEVSIHIEGGY